MRNGAIALQPPDLWRLIAHPDVTYVELKHPTAPKTGMTDTALQASGTVRKLPASSSAARLSDSATHAV
ncbi:hypothetical protein GCM10009872_12530 [Actinopolymorpha rutila]